MKALRRMLPLACLLLAGCQTMQKLSEVGTSVGVATGAITEEQAESINRSATAVAKTFESVTPEQEYYLGRTVAATLLNTYPPWDNAAASEYLNTVGAYLALFSDRPETFGGYHFQVMEADDVNAFAAPGGLILVSRGMLRCCRAEDELAAVLAHEIGHVQLRHGLQAISKSRLTEALTVLGTESAKQFGGQQLADLTRAFEGSVSDITSTLANSGYSRHFERQADVAAVTILTRAGYDPHALVTMLTAMNQRLKPGGGGFAKTHPDPKDRIADVNRLTGGGPAAGQANAVRARRFQRALGGV